MNNQNIVLLLCSIVHNSCACAPLVSDRKLDGFHQLFLTSGISQTFFVICSGLAVVPNMADNDDGAARDRVFGMAQNASADESGQVRRTITMVSSPLLFHVGL